MALDTDKKILLAQNKVKRLTSLLKQAEDSGEEDDYTEWENQLNQAENKLGRLLDDKKALK
jgi:uncharacterized protein YpuA (DUF1002 family)